MNGTLKKRYEKLHARRIDGVPTVTARQWKNMSVVERQALAQQINQLHEVHKGLAGNPPAKPRPAFVPVALPVGGYRYNQFED